MYIVYISSKIILKKFLIFKEILIFNLIFCKIFRDFDQLNIKKEKYVSLSKSHKF